MFLIPISHEDQRVTRLPWVTISLIAVNVAIFLITHSMAQRETTAIRAQIQEVVRFAREHSYLRFPQELARTVPATPPPADVSTLTIADQQAQLDRMLQDLQTMTARSVFRAYGYVPAHGSPLTLFTSMFMHGGWLHLIGNMLFLWLAGTSLEDRWGRLIFLILYMASGAIATLTHASVHPESIIPMVGASGAIAGLMGAFLVRLATTRIRFFYWIYFIQGTFSAPAYVVLPLWLLQQFAMAGSSQAGGVAVWAHIGGFAFGVAAAFLILGTELEAKFLTPVIQKKTTWTVSERMNAALNRLDRGEVDRAITELQALLRLNPESIEARTPLIAAYEQKGDHASAGIESARLVGGYVWLRDMEGALSAAQAHDRSYRDVPLFMRDLLALAAYREKQEQYAEAAQLYQ
ncbi:MAG TPA: rhomboid family intramembrane serine protease, partial [Candidatus Methylomirabilis sp.]|nr:rhomboid family intramembrane serine protease [Candidatus Methylomirabilis sp.]